MVSYPFAKINRLFPVYIVLSLIWLSSLSVFFLNRWDHDLGPIDSNHAARIKICMANYSEPKAQERCMRIMDLEHFQSLQHHDSQPGARLRYPAPDRTGPSRLSGTPTV